MARAFPRAPLPPALVAAMRASLRSRRRLAHCGALWFGLAALALRVASGAQQCRACVSLFKGIGDLGVTDENCNLLADLASTYWVDDQEGSGLADAPPFNCDPHFTPTTIEACAMVDADMAQRMYDKFDTESYSLIGFYFFIVFDVGIIDVCHYPSSHPYNQKGVAFYSSCTGAPTARAPGTTTCERPPRPRRASPPPPDGAATRCTGKSSKMTIHLQLPQE